MQGLALLIPPRDRGTSGSIAGANEEVIFDTGGGYNTAILSVSGTWVATLTVNVSADGVNWIATVDGFNEGAYYGPSAYTFGGIFTGNQSGLVFNLAGWRYIRVRATAYTSGTASVIWRATTALMNPKVALMAVNDAGTNYAILKTHTAGLADATTNPSHGSLRTFDFPHIFNGSTWDRIRSILNGNNSTGTGIQAAGILAQLDDVSPTTITENQFGNLRMTGERGLHVSPRPSTNSGYTPGKLISAASTNATSVKASAATVGWITASNVNAAARYLKIYDKASAPTVGTDTPVQVYLIPGNTAGAGTNIPLPDQGIALTSGFAFALTTGAADSDTGAVAASEIIVNYGYV